MKRVSLIAAFICVALSGCGFSGRSVLTEKDAAAQLAETDVKQPVRGEFVFQKNYSRSAKLNNASEGSQTVFLYLGEKSYYAVDVPRSIEYITDNSKYIYAKDGSYSVSVLSGIDTDQFSTMADVTDAETYSKYVVATGSDSKSELKEAAVYLTNSKSIVARTYNCTEAFDTILNGMLVNKCAVTGYGELDTSQAKESLPKYTTDGYEISVTAGLGSDIQKIYTFSDGTLTIARELRQFDNACETIGVRLAVVVDSDVVDTYYNDGELFYIDADNYFACVLKVNYNTVLTCFGSGDEAKVNAMEFVNSQ